MLPSGNTAVYTKLPHAQLGGSYFILKATYVSFLKTHKYSCSETLVAQVLGTKMGRAHCHLLTGGCRTRRIPGVTPDTFLSFSQAPQVPIQGARK